MSIETLKVSNLQEWLVGKVDWLLFSMSYEARSPIIWSNLSKTSIRFMGFHNANHDYNREAVANARGAVTDLLEIPLNSDEPLESLDAMRAAVSSHIVGHGSGSIAVDITCFTRESLALLIMTLRYLLPSEGRIYCLYTKASGYGNGPKDTDYHGWLTRGITGIRSILGYRGRVRLVADTHLVLLPGLEIERAHAIIDGLQPNQLTIGRIDETESIRPEFAPVVGAMNERLVNYYPDQKIAHFSFSSRDPIFTMRNLLLCVGESENTVVACLNTKLAMMGVIMAALSNRNIQLVYAQPAQYNIKSLSEPSDEVLVFEVPLNS